MCMMNMIELKSNARINLEIFHKKSKNVFSKKIELSMLHKYCTIVFVYSKIKLTVEIQTRNFFMLH